MRLDSFWRSSKFEDQCSAARIQKGQRSFSFKRFKSHLNWTACNDGPTRARPTSCHLFGTDRATWCAFGKPFFCFNFWPLKMASQKFTISRRNQSKIAARTETVEVLKGLSKTILTKKPITELVRLPLKKDELAWRQQPAFKRLRAQHKCRCSDRPAKWPDDRTQFEHNVNEKSD